MHTWNHPSLICGPRNLDSSLCRQCYLTGPCLYIHKEITHSSWRNELCIRHPGPELKERERKKNIFWKANAAREESHMSPCCWKNPEFKCRTNPFYSSNVRDNVFAVVCDALTSVPGIFSIKHTWRDISFLTFHYMSRALRENLWLKCRLRWAASCWRTR